MSRLQAATLARLRALARITADAEVARLASTAQSRARLRAALSDLGKAEAPLAPSQETTPEPAGMAGPDSARLSPADPRRNADPPLILDPALVRARLAHAVWLGSQRANLNARLAMIEADWHRLYPVAARAFGRVQALDGVARQIEARARRRQDARSLREGPQIRPERSAGADTDPDTDIDTSNLGPGVMPRSPSGGLRHR